MCIARPLAAVSRSTVRPVRMFSLRAAAQTGLTTFCFGVPTGHAVHIMGLGFFKTAAQPAIFQRLRHIVKITKYPPVRGKMYLFFEIICCLVL